MATNTINYNLVKPADNESADIGVINANMDIIDTSLKGLETGKEAIIKSAAEKTTLVDADTLPVIDSKDSSKTKKLSFANLKILLKTIFATTEDISALNAFLSKLNAEATQSLKGLMNATDKTKLDGVEEGANNYTHPTSAGNNHIPTGGTVGQIMQNTASGTATWQDLVASEITLSVASQTLYGVLNVDLALQKVFGDMHNYVVVPIVTGGAFTVPIGVDEIDILAIGGGQGGYAGGSSTSMNYNYTGGYGGNSASACGISGLKVVSGSILAITIGAGSAGASTANASYGGQPSAAGGDTIITYQGETIIKAVGGASSTGAIVDTRLDLVTTIGVSTPHVSSDGYSAGISIRSFFAGLKQIFALSSGGQGGGFGSSQPHVGSSGGTGAGNGGNCTGSASAPTNGTSATAYGCGGGGGGASNTSYGIGAGGNGKQGVVYIGYYKAV